MPPSLSSKEDKWKWPLVWGLGPSNAESEKATRLYYDNFLEHNRLISGLLQQPFGLGPTYAEFGKLGLILQ